MSTGSSGGRARRQRQLHPWPSLLPTWIYAVLRLSGSPGFNVWLHRAAKPVVEPPAHCQNVRYVKERRAWSAWRGREGEARNQEPGPRVGHFDPVPWTARWMRPKEYAMSRNCRFSLLTLLLLGPVQARAAVVPDSVVTAGLERYMAAAAAEGFRGAVLVARGENVLLARGYGTTIPGGNRPITAETVFSTGSITKQFTATAILKLETQGKLSVQDELGRWFDAVPADKSGITLHQLLTHTAGFPGAIGDDRERIGRDVYVQRALATPLLFSPGSRYEYSNVGYSLLAAIVEKASGQ